MPSTSGPDTQQRFTKGQVNRSGKLLLDLREAIDRVGPEQGVAQFDQATLDEAWEALTWWRALHARPLSTVAANLRYHALKVVEGEGDLVAVTQRLKRLATMIDKLTRERGQITQMQDIGGVRVVLPTSAHVYALRRRLLKSWTIIRERDYIAQPKASGYRALHLIVQRRGYPIEVQLRTVGQDIWANTVEEQGRELGVGIKFGAGGEDLQLIFITMSELFASYDDGVISANELIESLRRLPSLTRERRAQKRSNEPR